METVVQVLLLQPWLLHTSSAHIWGGQNLRLRWDGKTLNYLSPFWSDKKGGRRLAKITYLYQNITISTPITLWLLFCFLTLFFQCFQIQSSTICIKMDVHLLSCYFFLKAVLIANILQNTSQSSLLFFLFKQITCKYISSLYLHHVQSLAS